jgi:hypothetical protein
VTTDFDDPATGGRFDCTAEKMMSAGIFINYRRDDTIATAGRIHDRLTQSFGKKRIFMDVDHIPAGADFIDYIESKLAECGVLLAIIGPHWVNARDGAGLRRLDDPKDVVLNEIHMALQRGIAVIPVLVDGADMPKAEHLPNALKPIARRNAVELRNSQFGGDADRLIRKIREVVKDSEAGTSRWWVAVAGAIATVLLGWGATRFVPAFSWLHFLSSNTIAVENCNRTLGMPESGLDFSGVFEGFVDDGQSHADVQLKLVRHDNVVNGSYFRAELCGTVRGEVIGNRLHFRWSWADNSGHGVANQNGGKLNGTSGNKENEEGAGTFELFQRNRD